MAAALIYGQEARLLPWAATVLGITHFRADAVAIGIERRGQIAAVVVFEDFSETNCNMHLASDGTGHWMNRALLVASFAYPFIQLGKLRVTALVPSKNAAALRLDGHLGFEVEGLCPKGVPDDDLVILGMLRENCRFIPKEP